MAVAELPGPEPQMPDMLLILEIHRHQDLMSVVAHETCHIRGTNRGQVENPARKSLG